MPARGRPPGSTTKAWADAVRKAANALDPKAKRKKLEQLAEALVNTALAGDVSALKEIGDRIDGKVPQAMIGGSENDPPVQHVHRVELVDLTPVKGKT